MNTNIFTPIRNKVSDVYQTSDLAQFKALEGNRPPNVQHIARLEKSIRENGFLINPIIVNEKRQVIDGHHRLTAAINTNTPIYYIVVDGYDLSHVQILNQNQKNWTARDLMYSYAEIGIESYVFLRDFCEENPDFNLLSCIAMCTDVQPGTVKLRDYEQTGTKFVFTEGTWVANGKETAQSKADKIRSVAPFYSGYNRANFVAAMLSVFQKKEFSLSEFIRKLKFQQTEMVDCAKQSQYLDLIETLYNYKRQKKVNLRY